VLSFYRWLQIQGARVDPVGDLARDARVDPAWPKRTEALLRLDRYLRDRGAGLGARLALRRAYGEWLIVTADDLEAAARS
jgi:uncharacterized protein YozE (UPF0346 family)